MKKLFAFFIILSLTVLCLSGCSADKTDDSPMKFPVSEEQINEVVDKCELDWNIFSYSDYTDGRVNMVAQNDKNFKMVIDISGDDAVKIVQLGFAFNRDTNQLYYEAFDDSLKNDFILILSELWGNKQAVTDTVNGFFIYFKNPDETSTDFSRYEYSEEDYFFDASLSREKIGDKWYLSGLGIFDKAYYDAMFEDAVVIGPDILTYKPNSIELSNEKTEEILAKASCDWELLDYAEWPIGEKSYSPQIHSGILIRYNGVMCSFNINRNDIANSVSIDIVPMNGEDTSFSALGEDGIADIKLIITEIWGNGDIVNDTFDKVFKSADDNATSNSFHTKQFENNYYYEYIINRPDNNTDWTLRRFTLMSSEQYKYETELSLKNQILQ